MLPAHLVRTDVNETIKRSSTAELRMNKNQQTHQLNKKQVTTVTEAEIVTG
jgi:hypothetical protein